MVLSKLKWNSKEEAYHLGLNLLYPNGYWSISFNKKTFHYNLDAKTLIGLVKKIIKTYGY